MLEVVIYISIKNVALLIKEIIGYKGKIYFNKSYPDGVKLRKLDSKRINKLGLKSTIIKNGLKTYCDYFNKKII